MRAVLLIPTLLALGCLRVEPAAPRDTSPQPVAQPPAAPQPVAPQPPAARPAKPAAPAPTVRDLDRVVMVELRDAFAGNAPAARKWYANQRFRFAARPHEIGESEVVLLSDLFGECRATFRAGEADKLRVKQPATIEALVESFDTASTDGPQFLDASVVATR
jgi:hypothetical protein